MRSKAHQRIVLLDTHAIVHRAYHALPDFTGPGGVPTGALYGLVSMLLRIMSELEPDYVAACYDLPKPTLRHAAYDGYKATRAKTDDALVEQLARARDVFAAFSIPLYEREGYEADDLLGTISHELAAHKDIDVIIASGDMDTLQLIDDKRVRVYTLKRGLNDTILYDEEKVRERFGFGPELIPDWKGLRGDPSDNIKGIPGIGEKTATELITKFGSIEEIYKTLKKGGDDAFIAAGIKARIVGLLRAHEEEARFSKSLAMIRRDAPIAFSLPRKPWRETASLASILELFDALGFRSLRDRARQALGERGRDSEEIVEAEEAPDPTLLAEAGVMLWLLSSEFTNPSYDDVLAFTKTRTLAEAHATLSKEIAAQGTLAKVYRDIERPLIPIVREMYAHGVLIDPTVLRDLAAAYGSDLAAIEKRIYAAAGREFNVSSPKQLGEVLFDELKIIPERQKKTAGGQRSTRESELEKIKDEHPIVADILEYRELKKLLSTYIENLPAQLDSEHRLHAEFLQTGTTTGRMASQNPNLQNIPMRTERGRAIRRAFIAPEGFELVSLDYSQIELRIAAILSGDEKLCDIFRNGRDVHQEVAAHVFHVVPGAVDAEMRRRAKIINFGILYGMGVNALRAQLGTTTADAHAFYDEYFAQFKTLSEYLESTKGFARKYGYTETLFGRRRQFPEMKSALPYVRAQAERMAINAPIQGTQADLIKLAMVRINEHLYNARAKDDAHLLMQVHDELVYEIRTSRIGELATEIKSIMESVLPREVAMGVPIIAVPKHGRHWGAMEPIT